MLEIILKLSLIALIPIAVCLVVNFFVKIRLFKDVSYMKQQIILGIIFGIVSILGTEFGVNVYGATVNVRDAAVVITGLVFGPESAIVAGIIGGVERWFAVLWGAGTYTRVACSVSTIVIGVLTYGYRKHMLNDELCTPLFAFMSTTVFEVFHMIMVLITHMDNPQEAFIVVQNCTIPMVLVNSLSVFCAVHFIRTFDKIEKERTIAIKISSIFQRRLLVVMGIAYLITSTFTFLIQYRISENNATELLQVNIDDFKRQISESYDNEVLTEAKNVASILSNTDEITSEYLAELALSFNVEEINIINANGVIVQSNVLEYVGYDMMSAENSRNLIETTKQETYAVQPTRPDTLDPSIYRKFACVVLNDGYMQIGLDESMFKVSLENEIKIAGAERHISKTGYFLVVNRSGKIISDIDDFVGANIKYFSSLQEFPEENQNVKLEGEFKDVDCYYMYDEIEGYTVIAIIPQDEITFTRNFSIYINTFLEIIVFAALFALIYILINNLVLMPFEQVNDSLKEITNGNLDEAVSVYDSAEFIALSKGINRTVISLKHYIEQANERIQAELDYAKSIQKNSLPSIFPPYPNRDEFEIYATMDAAKSVGGDFYDFYLLDDNHLLFLVADVSGKGIPAALFMMRAKTLLKTYAQSGYEIDEVVTLTNDHLCEGNEAGLFVTAWVGILDLTTGLVKYANAGHNPPCIRRKGGYFEYLHSKVNLVLAGMEGVVYRRQELQLNPGDEIYVYTDGVTEAINTDKELFGEDRLLQSLNSNIAADCETTCHDIKADIDEYAGEEPQFDDITMLNLKLFRLNTPEEEL